MLLAESLVETPAPISLGSWEGCKEDSEILPVAREFIEDKGRRNISKERWARSREAMTLEGWGVEFLSQAYLHNPWGPLTEVI